jgi:hypothetical protein
MKVDINNRMRTGKPQMCGNQITHLEQLTGERKTRNYKIV